MRPSAPYKMGGLKRGAKGWGEGYWGSHMTMCMHVCGCALVRWVCAWVRVRLLCKRAVFFYALLISLFAAHCCRCCFFVTAFGPLLRFAFWFFTVLTSIYQVRTCVCVWVCFLLTAMHFDCWLFSYISFFSSCELEAWNASRLHGRYVRREVTVLILDMAY